MKWQKPGRMQWCMLVGIALGVLALLAACGGSGSSGGGNSAAGSGTDTKAQTAVATIVGGLGGTVSVNATVAASAVSQLQTQAPSVNATITAVAGTATAFAPTVQAAAGGTIATVAASTAIIPTVPQATFVSGIQTAASATNPTVRILAPVPNATIPGGAGIDIGYIITGVNLPLTATTSTPVTGTHVVVVLDDTIKAGQPIPNDGRHVHTLGRVVMLKNITPGAHTARVVVVDDKNVPFANPEAQASVTFTTT